MNLVGLDSGRFVAWLADQVPDARPPFRHERLAGGNSNLTFALTSADGQRFVVRRPPLHGVLETANDMAREWRAVAGLQHTAVPVPPAVGFCDDPSVLGAPFFVTGFVDGVVHHQLSDTEAGSNPAQRRRLGCSMVEVLADLHAVDPAAVGLDGHGRRGGYLERQLHRWYRQYAATRTTDLPDVAKAYTTLLDRLPAEGDTVVVHGDFRLGNCIATPEGPVAAVVDWEISTIGDPLADLGFLLATWARPGSAVGALHEAATAPSMAEGFQQAGELLEIYAARSGRDVEGIDWYVAFNHWRFACITQGVAARLQAGALGTATEQEVGAFTRSVAERAALAVRSLDPAPYPG